MVSVGKIDIAINYVLLLYALVAGISRGGVYTTIILLTLLTIIRYIKEPFPLNINNELTVGARIMFGALVLSTIFSSHFLMSLKSLAELVLKIVPFFIAATFIKTNKMTNKIVMLMSVSLFMGSLVAIWQGLHGMGRATSFLGIMDFAGVIGLLFPVLIVYCFDYKSEEKWKSYLLGLGAIVAIIALLFNGTRSILISTIVCSFVYLLISGGFRNKRVVVSIIAGISLIVAVGIFNDSFAQRVGSIVNLTTDRSNLQRMNMWHYAIDVFKEHPFIGTGFGAFPTSTGGFDESGVAKTIWDVAKGDHVHNIFLQNMVENGIVGLTAFIFFLYSIIKSIWRNMHNSSTKMWAQIALLCTLDFIIHGMFDYVINIRIVIYTYCFLLGMAFANFKENSNMSR